MLVFEAQAPGTTPVPATAPLVYRLFRRLPDDVPVATPVKPVELSWEVMLRRCREIARADCVFAVDGSGIVVGREGTYGRAEVDRVAAHLSRAFDLLDDLTEIGSESESICARYAEGRWLTAVRIRPDEERVITVGVIGPYTLITQDRLRLRNTFLRMFGAVEANEAA
ncbi:MAG TPA: hypothetical protein VND21_08110 [Planctomycetota bacterium]|nr:hypothetical protein [Planctomycetota bacterium]